MVRCEALNVKGKQCKRKGNVCCFFHRYDICGLCKEQVKYNILGKCGHKFCKYCLANDVYDNQWFDGFNTSHPIICPTCDKKVSDTDWSMVMDYLVESSILYRKIVYTCYLDKQWINELHSLVLFGKEYTVIERDKIEDLYFKKNTIHLYLCVHPDEIPSKVYFYNNDDYFLRRQRQENLYSFEIDYELLKSKNETFHKELIEYVFHPKRLERLGKFNLH
jgi:hypothetical protein